MKARFGIQPYRYTWDPEAEVFVVDCTMEVDDMGLHPIATQGRTMAEARAAMDSAVEMTIKHWPPRTP